jgi:predicted dehydrogenase
VSRLRAGVIGLGVGERHLEAYARDPRCEVVAVCDRDPDRLAAGAGRAPAARALTEADELLGLPGLDAVSICSHDPDHAAQALAALGAGLHVMVEKPLCRTRAELDALAAAVAARPDLVLASNLVLRAAPLVRWLVARRAAGELGTVFAIDGDYLYGRLPKITEGWRGGVEGYSVMLGGGVHLVDVLMRVAGERPEWVEAAGSGLATRGTAFAGDDLACAQMGFPGGAIGRVSANFACVHGHQHVIRVFGTAATVISDDRGVRVQRSRDPAPPAAALDLAPVPDDKGALIPAFVSAALGTAPADPGARHELDLVAVCLAADRSRAEGRRVAVEYPAPVGAGSAA